MTEEDKTFAIVLKENNKVIGLFHDTIYGCKMDNGTITNEGLSSDIFKDCDAVMCGHIHKFQELKKNGIKIVYPSSLIQQTFGESITQHGFCVWDIENLNYNFINIDSQYSRFDIEISNIDDLINDKEILLNL